MIRSVILPLLFLVLSSGLTDARTVEELQVAYEVKILALEKELQEGLEKLNKGYLRALNGVQKNLQDAGRLDDVLIVVQEKKDLREGKWPLSALADSAPDNLIRVRKLYEQARIRAERDHAEALIETSEKMEELLAAKMDSLTRAGNIAEAKKAKDQLEALKNSPKVTDARDLVRRVRLNQVAPIAMRLRRSGDDLEVLVRYDKGGKVSLDSPVENVVELTGGKKEKGDTSASVLGEFVGAKGYEVDSFVAFESEMEKVTSPMRAGELEIKAGFEIEGKQALRIMMPDNLKNPLIAWSGILEPIASASIVQLDFTYYIPPENQKFKAFTFQWGFGAPFEDEVMNTAGRWVTESLASESPNQLDTLRFYPANVARVNGFTSGGNESIYLDDMKVSYLSFAAHLVQTYQDGKPVDDPVADPVQQKAIALAGKLLPSQ